MNIQNAHLWVVFYQNFFVKILYQCILKEIRRIIIENDLNRSNQLINCIFISSQVQKDMQYYQHQSTDILRMKTSSRNKKNSHDKHKKEIDQTKTQQHSSEQLKKKQSRKQQQQQITKKLLANQKVSLYLYAGNLPRFWKKDDIISFFSQYGTIQDVIPLKNNYNQFTGAAQIKFESLSEAESAIQKLHKKKMPGFQFEIRLRWLDTEEQRLGIAQMADHKLFVGSLPRQVSNQSLIELFSILGQVQSIILQEKQFWALLTYTKKESAILAIRFLNGQAYMHGSKIPIEVRFKQRRYNSYMTIKKMVKEQEDPFVFVPDHTYYQEINREGKVYFYHLKSKKAQLNPPPPGSKIFGISNNYIQDGEVDKDQKVSFQINTKKTGPVGSNLFLFHLANSVQAQELYQKFGKFGKILSVNITMDSTGRSKGMGFVSYDCPESAQLAIQQMNGFELYGKRLKVELNQKDQNVLAKRTNQIRLQDYNFNL